MLDQPDLRVVNLKRRTLAGLDLTAQLGGSGGVVLVGDMYLVGFIQGCIFRRRSWHLLLHHWHGWCCCGSRQS